MSDQAKESAPAKKVAAKKVAAKQAAPAKEPAAPSQLSKLEELLKVMQPVLDFHKAVDEATDDDLRIFWDVRVIRGKDTPFLSTAGSSTLAGAMSGSASRLLTVVLQDEVSEKIGRPLVSRAQDIIGPLYLERINERSAGDQPLLGHDDGGDDDDGDAPDHDLEMSIAAARLAQSEGVSSDV